jgi:hypothetical protein
MSSFIFITNHSAFLLAAVMCAVLLSSVTLLPLVAHTKPSPERKEKIPLFLLLDEE